MGCQMYTLENLTAGIGWNPKNAGLEDDFPFQLEWFLGSMLICGSVSAKES